MKSIKPSYGRKGSEILKEVEQLPPEKVKEYWKELHRVNQENPPLVSISDSNSYEEPETEQKE